MSFSGFWCNKLAKTAVLLSLSSACQKSEVRSDEIDVSAVKSPLSEDLSLNSIADVRLLTTSCNSSSR